MELCKIKSFRPASFSWTRNQILELGAEDMTSTVHSSVFFCVLKHGRTNRPVIIWEGWFWRVPTVVFSDKIHTAVPVYGDQMESEVASRSPPGMPHICFPRQRSFVCLILTLLSKGLRCMLFGRRVGVIKNAGVLDLALILSHTRAAVFAHIVLRCVSSVFSQRELKYRQGHAERTAGA